ncbi:MAG TPA: MoxR family ATPase [Acidimicrobiales bacterium]|nr:MoxR family ATPase [Acidimicrobiales bacterium]
MASGQRAVARNAATFAGTFEAIVENIEVVLQGKEEAIRLALVCMVAEGHLLIEDVPGVGKTSLAKALAASVDADWHRIQFTPDLLPSDVTGVTVYSRATESFEFRRGGIFANVVLGDEINRASPKTQSALLEAMEERQVTVDATTYRLPSPFMVIATQNPIEHEGTYPLPESQLDRFLMRIAMGYPARGAEMTMLDTHASGSVIDELEAVATPRDVEAMIRVARAIHVAPNLKGYIVDLAAATRSHPGLQLGMSPRAALALQRASRALAAARGRDYVVPDDLKALARPILEHRLTPTPEAQLGGIGPADALEDVLASLPVPTAR